MSIRCLLGTHAWEGCKCLTCRKTRDEGHDWSKDCEKCARCGAARQNTHQWQGCKCPVCGQNRNEAHDWGKNLKKCSICGTERSDEEVLASLIPESAYPLDQTEKDRCKSIEAFLYGAWGIFDRFRAKSFEYRHPERSGEIARRFAGIKALYLDYLLLCRQSKASAPIYLLHELTRKYPESGLTWYCLLLALDPDNTTKAECLLCLTNAARFGCDYVKPDGEGGLVFAPLL